MKRSIWGLTVVLGLLVIRPGLKAVSILIRLLSFTVKVSTILQSQLDASTLENMAESGIRKMVPLIIEALVRKKYASAYRLFSMFRQKFPQSPFFRLYYVTELLWREKYQQAITSFPVHWNPGLKNHRFLILSNTEKICSSTANDFEIPTMPLNELLEVVKFHEIANFSLMGRLLRHKIAEEFRNVSPFGL